MKIQNQSRKGFAPINLVVIAALVIVVGGAAYGVYRYAGQKPGASILPKEGAGQLSKIPGPKNLEPTAKTATATPKPKKQGNFSHQGALIAEENGWTFLWDEPGRLALTVKLKFTNQSICIFGTEKKDCGLINLGPESYNRASVEGNRVGDEVTVIKMEELKPPQ